MFQWFLATLIFFTGVAFFQWLHKHHREFRQKATRLVLSALTPFFYFLGAYASVHAIHYTLGALFDFGQ